MKARSQETQTQNVEYMRYKPAAAFLGVSVNTLYGWVYEGRVPHIRLGKRLVIFDRAQLVDFLRSKAVSPFEAP